jgi:hypothetical protein
MGGGLFLSQKHFTEAKALRLFSEKHFASQKRFACFGYFLFEKRK